jgi:RNA recognition motif-containing protein
LSTVFVGNLSSEVTDSDLRQLFGTYGKINSIRLISRRGFAFIELDAEAANAAVDGLRGTQLKGRTVDIALEPAGGGGKRKRGFRR